MFTSITITISIATQILAAETARRSCPIAGAASVTEAVWATGVVWVIAATVRLLFPPEVTAATGITTRNIAAALPIVTAQLPIGSAARRAATLWQTVRP